MAAPPTLRMIEPLVIDNRYNCNNQRPQIVKVGGAGITAPYICVYQLIRQTTI